RAHGCDSTGSRLARLSSCVRHRIFAIHTIFRSRARLMAELNSRKRNSPHQSIIPQSAPGLRIARHRDEISAAIARVVASGRYVLGAECEAFEEEFARSLGAPFTIGVNSGTDALSLALL